MDVSIEKFRASSWRHRALSDRQRRRQCVHFQYALCSPCLLSIVYLKMTNSYWKIDNLTLHVVQYSTITAVTWVWNDYLFLNHVSWFLGNYWADHTNKIWLKSCSSTVYSCGKQLLDFLFWVKNRTFKCPVSRVIRRETLLLEIVQLRTELGCSSVPFIHNAHTVVL